MLHKLDRRDAIAKFAFNKLEGRTAAIILDDKNDYAVVLARFFDESFTRLGGRIVIQQRYDASDRDVAAQVVAIKAAAPDVIFAPGFYTTAPLVARAVKESGVKSILIGSDGWDSPDLLKGGSEPFESVYFANHFWAGSDDPVVKRFVENYRAKYGVEPDSAAATAYDAAHMLFAAFKRAKSNDKDSRQSCVGPDKRLPGCNRKDHPGCKSKRASACIHAAD